jgi:YHS domain-containing protein
MITTLIASLALGLQGPAPLACPVMGSSAEKPFANVDYAGIRFGMCCGGCDSTFQKDPEKFIRESAKKNLTVGQSLFDPTTGVKPAPKEIVATADYMGVRYPFTSAANKTAFEKNAKKLAARPTKEALMCPVTGEAVKSEAAAAGYADHEGVRYYFCCAGCLGQAKNIATIAVKAKSAIKPVAATPSPKS